MDIDLIEIHILHGIIFGMKSDFVASLIYIETFQGSFISNQCNYNLTFFRSVLLFYDNEISIFYICLNHTIAVSVQSEEVTGAEY